MSTSTTSYASLLGGMWAPEGSEMNERLKRLQELEQMRKEREAKRQEMLKEKGQSNTTGIVRTSRLKSSDPELGTSTGIGIRRTLSMREDSDNYGGARPKVGGLSSNGQEESGGFGNMFSDIKASVLGPRKPMRGEREYGTRTRVGSSDSEDSNTSSTYSRSRYDYSRANDGERSYGRSYSKPEGNVSEENDDGSIFSSITRSVISGRPGLERKPYTSRIGNEQSSFKNGLNGFDYKTPQTFTGEYSNGHVNSGFETQIDQENGDHDENNEEDHGEEPKYFIERLKQGNGDSVDSGMNFNHSKNNEFVIQSMPSVPPLKQTAFEHNNSENQYQDVPELVQPTDDILSVAQEISSTFGYKSPRKTPERNNCKNKNSQQKKSASTRKSKKMATPGRNEPSVTIDNSGNRSVDNGFTEDPNVSITYEIHEVDYDSSGDERGKLLPVRDSLYQAGSSEWDVLDQTSGKLDQMQEYFTGEDVGEDPNISRELDGRMVKAELEKSFSEVKNVKRVNDRNSGRKTPTNIKKSAKKEKANAASRSKSPLDKVKKSSLKSSESENDSVHTSGSENDVIGMKNSTPRRNTAQNNRSAKKGDKNEMSLSDKLAKLESMTQEKKRKHSVGENEVKKPIPSYMSGTSASQQKKSRTKDESPKPTRDLKKDVRELKQFVHEHCSEPNTPVSSPTKSVTDIATTEIEKRKSTREISVQTEFVIDFPDINYVCKHCGKSSFEVQSPLTEVNLNKTYTNTENKNKRASPNNEKAKPSETKFSSKDSVKSLGEMSSKSEKNYRYKPKTVTNAQSYMKGTTSSRLKNTGGNSDGKARKGSAPEIVHRAELESAQGSTSLKGAVSQRTKAIENANKHEKNKPTLSLFRGKSVERNKPEVSGRPRLAKSKSVDHVNVIKNEIQKPTEDNAEFEKQVTQTKTDQSESSTAQNVPPSPGEKRSRSQMTQKAASPKAVEPPATVEKLDLSSLVSPSSPMSPRSPSFRKPPLASPRIKDIEVSPRSESSDVIDDNTAVESKGQFTTIVDNPFIKNDVRRRNSLRGCDKGESVWEKAESRSRDSSLKRANSTSEADGERPNSASSLRRHNTSAGEKSSVSELTWSDSGSTGSLRGSRSSLHGSNSSLNRDGKSAFHRPRTVSASSGTSQTSQNTMLNLLSPVGTSRHPVSGAMETDIDAAYNDHVKESKTEEHNEDTVNRTHLEFAKKACDMLEFEMKKRDSSNESDRETSKTEENKENDNEYKKVNGGDNRSQVNGTENSKKEKGMKGFLKGKLFKK